MQLFECMVNVSSSEIPHQVPKAGVSELELRLLRAIHGEDAISGLKRADVIERKRSSELGRLASIYGAPAVKKHLGELPDDFDEWVNGIQQSDAKLAAEEELAEEVQAAVPAPRPAPAEEVPEPDLTEATMD